MAESKSSIATGSTVEEFVPKRGATSVVWKWFRYKLVREDCNSTRGQHNKVISPPLVEAPG